MLNGDQNPKIKVGPQAKSWYTQNSLKQIWLMRSLYIWKTETKTLNLGLVNEQTLYKTQTHFLS